MVILSIIGKVICCSCHCNMDYVILTFGLFQTIPPKQNADRLIIPTAFLLAGLGVGVSSFSLKQLLSKAAAKHA